MKKAYIITAHKNPDQLNRLINRLDDGHSMFFVHIDRKVDISPFKRLLQFGDKLRYVERVASRWASLGSVHATLNALKAIVATGESFQMINLLSGQDYPIKTNEEIDRFFKSSPCSVFLDYLLLPDYDKWPSDGGIWRVNNYYFGEKKLLHFSGKLLSRISRHLPFLQKKVPAGMQVYFGSAWLSMDLETAKYILSYTEEHPAYIAFHRNNFSPDELFYQMILVNSSDAAVRSRIGNDNKRFIKWKNLSTPNPEILKMKDFDEIRNSTALFARKFDPVIDAAILDRIDTDILGRL